MSCTALLLLLAAQAVTSMQLDGTPSPTRRLLEGASAVCPDGCMDSFCVQASTPGGLRCSKCKGNLLVDKVSGRCACPPGRYSNGSETCVDCPRGSYCTGGIFSLSAPPVNVACPEHMTTLGLRSRSAKACVNMPGYSYTTDASGSLPSATLCPVNTYSPGLKKQRACVPCSTGFTTNGAAGASAATACVVPAGWYLKAPGQAASCPEGEWKSGVGATGQCTKCALGVTTERAGSTSESDCKKLVAGYHAISFSTTGAINATAICPQSYVCPGGVVSQAELGMRRLAQAATSATIVPCPDGLWTQLPGATSMEQCLTPPGYFTAAGTTQPCPDGSFRSDWLPAAQASSCAPCGVGMKADTTDRLTQYLNNGSSLDLPVTTSDTDCYIEAGQGLMLETLTQTWRAKDCTANSYGVANRTYGRTASPCKDCPAGMVAVNNATYSMSAQYFRTSVDGSGGFTSDQACVTMPGYGLSGRVAQRCDQGYFNPGNNYDKCSACPYGTTTAGPGAGVTAADCKTGLGYGQTDGKMGQCPIGTFSDQLAQNASAACKTCPGHTSTMGPGADSATACQVCVAGYGGPNCDTMCGGVGGNATYGPPGRSISSPDNKCVPCSGGGQTVTYSYTWQLENDAYTPRTVARLGAASPFECLSEYSQIVDGSYWLPLSSTEGVTETLNVTTFAACVDLCSAAQCQLVTYDYVQQTCYVRVSQAPVYEGMPWLALKVLPSGYVGASSVKTAADPDQGGHATAKTISSGVYTFYQEPQALAVGTQEPAPNRSSFRSVQDCLAACDDAGDRCSGVTVLSTVEPVDIGKTCALIKANTRPGVYKRTMIRADLNHLGLPTGFLCPSGYQQSSGTTAPCSPLDSPAVVVFSMTATGQCDASTTNSLRTALYNFVSSPFNAFGVYGPSVRVVVACVDIPAGQARRRLQQSSNKVRVDGQIQFTGPLEPASAIVQQISTAGCNVTGLCEKIANPSTQLSLVAPGAEKAPVGSVTLRQLPITSAIGLVEFEATYELAGQPADSSQLVAFPSPANAMTCNRSVLGNTTKFVCTPLRALTSVSLTVTAPNPQNVEVPATAAVSVRLGCTRGHYPSAANATCTPCERGTYAAANSTVCTPCPDGFTTLNTTSYNISQCTECIPGRYGLGCTRCDKGSISQGGTASNSLSCTNCQTGFTTGGTGFSSCTACAGGYAGANCTACPVRFWAPEATQGTQNCTQCATGRTTAGNTTDSAAGCSVCLPGFGGGSCNQCAAGTYSPGGSNNPGEAAASCTSCRVGMTTPSAGSVSSANCTDCLPGYFGTNCTACPIGSTSPGATPAESLVCRPCPDGKTTVAPGSAQCTNCLPGREGPNCTACDVGFISPGGPANASLTCSTCAAMDLGEGFTTFGKGQSSCNVCKPGYAGIDCRRCERGAYTAGGNVSSSLTCTSCRVGWTTYDYASVNSSDCAKCADGYVMTSNGTECIPCALGTYWAGGVPAVCKPCPTGAISSGPPSRSCDMCLPGYGQFTCSACPNGTYSKGGILVDGIGLPCIKCPNGTTSGEGAANCTVCLPGYAGVNCTACPVRTTSSGGPAAESLVCNPCAAGWTTTGTAASACDVKIKVLVLHAELAFPGFESKVGDVKSVLEDTSAFSQVDLFSGALNTPTPAQLQQYDAVLVYSMFPWANQTALGDNLARFFDAGGSVVVANPGDFNGFNPLGAWASGGYNLISASGLNTVTQDQPLIVMEADSPLMKDVTTLTGRASTYDPLTLEDGAVVVAKWGGGQPLIVRGMRKGRNMVALNLFPTEASSYLSGDGAAIMRNALQYV